MRTLFVNRHGQANTLDRATPLVFLALAGALLTGCIDRSKDPALYRKILDGQHPATMPAFDPAASLSLERALQLADADNETIASRGEDYIQALADKMKAAGNFLPTIGLAPSFNAAQGDSSGFVIGGGSSGTPVQVISGGPSLSHQFTVPLDASATGSLASVATLQASSRTIAQRIQLLLDERETILLSVVTSYYGALKAERQVAVYENSVRLKGEKVRDQEARLKLGGVRPLDVAQSQADAAAARVSLTQARTDAANARSALARLIGVPSVDGALSDAFRPPADVPAREAWQKLAEQKRQDLLAAGKAVEAARLKVDAAIREYLPSVTVDFSYFLYNDPSSPQRWTGAITGNVPIFSALAIEADIRTAWSIYRQAGLAQSQVRRQVVDDINQNYQNLNNSRLKIVDLHVQVAAAQKAYDLAERAYRLGSDSNLDRLTQQDNLLTAQLNLISEEFNEKTSYFGLLRASGTLATVIRTER